MDDGGRDNRRHRSSTAHQLTSPLFQQWNTMPQYQQFKEQNAFSTTAKIGILCEEKEAALKERDRAIAETKAILEEMELAIKQRDAAIVERDNALKERDNAIAALQFHENTMNALFSGGARGIKRMIQPMNNLQQQPPLHHSLTEECIYDAFPVSAVQCEGDPTSQKETRTKTNKKGKVKSTRPSKKSKKIGEDLNRKVTTDGSKAEWEAQDLGSTDQMIMFDESTMPVPVCSCTGVAHQCYKWGNGGWQSSCCTTALSEYPLPQMPNKRHARMGGRKMSGSVFSRLLTRLGTGGYDLSTPLDLKNYWARHGTNRYITIK